MHKVFRRYQFINLEFPSGLVRRGYVAERWVDVDGDTMVLVEFGSGFGVVPISQLWEMW